MRTCSRLIAVAVCAAMFSASVARADDLLAVTPDAPERSGPPVAWGLVAGTLTGMIPLAIGSGLFAENSNNGDRKAASLTIAYGMALAPIVSHLVVREWKRAAIFGALPLVCAVGVTALLEIQPTATSFGSRSGRWAYGLLMSLNVAGAGFGIIDTLGAKLRDEDRARAEQKLARIPVLPAPIVTQGGGGLAVLGSF
jgi:hypothetical protein